VWEASVRLIFSADRQTLDFPDSDGSGQPPYTMSRTGENTYQWSGGGLTLNLTFTSATSFTISHNGQYGDCGHFIAEGTGTYQG
jgi:hypothetical protein